MSHEAYRVRKRFQWRGWEFAPSGDCDCECPGCTGQTASNCEACFPEACRCKCNILPEIYGGDIWIVEDGHPRKKSMLDNRFAIGDASIPPADELMKDPQFARLLSPPGEAPLPRTQHKPTAKKKGTTRIKPK